MKKNLLLIPVAVVLLLSGCSRFRNAPTEAKDARYIVIDEPLTFLDIRHQIPIHEEDTGVGERAGYRDDRRGS